MPFSSSDSDTDERIKNVRNLYVSYSVSRQETSSNHSYKRKLGDLIFDANFEAGNLGSAKQVGEFEFDLTIRPDVTNPRHRLWFNFTVSNQSPGQSVIFTFVNLSEIVELFICGLTPVVRSKSNPNWLRLRRDQVFYYNSRAHNSRRVLSIVFRFATHDDDHQFALFYPYTTTNLYSFLNRLKVESERYKLKTIANRCDARTFKIEELGTSILSKPIKLVQIADNKDCNECLTKVIVIGRSLGNMESVSSFVCQGLVDFAICDHPIARLARKSMRLVVIPMLDPDSVIVGNTRSDIFGQTDMTPKLVQSNRLIYSSINQVIELVRESASSQRTILLDFRVNIKLIGVRTVSILYDDQCRMERHLQLPRLFARFINSFYLEKCVFLEKGSGPSIPIDDIRRSEKNLDWFGLEISPFGTYKRRINSYSYEEFSTTDYLLIGRGILYSLTEMLYSRKAGSLSSEEQRELERFKSRPHDVDELILDQSSSQT